MLAMTITHSKEVKCWLAAKQVRCQYEGILIRLVRVVWYVTHSGCECKLCHYVLYISEKLLDHLPTVLRVSCCNIA